MGPSLKEESTEPSPLGGGQGGGEAVTQYGMINENVHNVIIHDVSVAYVKNRFFSYLISGFAVNRNRVCILFVDL